MKTHVFTDTCYLPGISSPRDRELIMSSITETPVSSTEMNVDRVAATQIVEQINFAASQGRRMTVNGRDVVTSHSTPASVWGTGSISVNVRAKRGGVDQTWVKPGQMITVVEFIPREIDDEPESGAFMRPEEG